MTTQKKKRFYNPVTGKYYEVKQHSSKYGESGEIKGLWSSKRKKKGWWLNMSKHRIFPMQICDADLDNWLTHPIVIINRLTQVLLKNNLTWKCTKIRFYPGLNGMSFEGKPFLCGLPQPLLHNLVLALVDVPDDEAERLFVTSSETGLVLEW